MIDALDIGYAIKDRRSQLGLTQAQVAEMSGVSKRCLWSLELGRNPGVQFNKLASVLEALGLELAIADGSLEAHPARTPRSVPDSLETQPIGNVAPVEGPIDALAILTEGKQSRIS